ncbi:MAG TPA: hypothetical protein VD966_06500, partial [Pyrinomonadaceae bacterium]|nr:hypothetical protein [Pyrinomonadaceae bacterium]
MIGAPGPESLSSPRLSRSITPSLIDPTAPSSSTPNRERIQCADAGPSTGTPVCDSSTQDVAPLGYLSVRRKFTNNSGADVTRLRFRIIEITNITNAGGLAPPVADLRAISSPGSGGNPNVSLSVNTGLGPIDVYRTVLEMPSAQSVGGGINSSLSAGSITLANPLPAAGTAEQRSINLQLLLGVKALGRFSFFVVIEALP